MCPTLYTFRPGYIIRLSRSQRFADLRTTGLTGKGA